MRHTRLRFGLVSEKQLIIQIATEVLIIIFSNHKVLKNKTLFESCYIYFEKWSLDDELRSPGGLGKYAAL